jgi:dTDP-4-dehydrorhamnose reductase
MLTGIPYADNKRPEIWGGVECTVNRVRDEFRDQLYETGHYSRPEDIGLFASLGISKLRYPINWEFHQSKENGRPNWEWASQQLNRIRELGMEPIAGLVHHGSGPAFTNLYDEKFAAKLAKYALRVSNEFPWIKYYTPVNEPLTTARFSGLYGFWYPHHMNEKSFIRMLINQVKGVILSMKEIRKVNPGAKLVQTEDLSKTHSTELLTYQGTFENERRWLTYDLLCGNFTNAHYLWKHVLGTGIKEQELAFFLENPCPPDIMGFNYYITSERYLDEKLEKYPSHLHGGNENHAYADTEAVRVIETAGLKNLLMEAWQRFGLPLAITECHLNCTREEQMRWLDQTWKTCCGLINNEKIDIKAITAWSLLGAYDWSSLLTQRKMHYEAGVFDVRCNKPRPTALAKMIRTFAEKKTIDHPLLQQPGWWIRKNNEQQAAPVKNDSSKLLIVGKNGTLGSAFMRICDQRAIPYIALSRNELDISNKDEISVIIDQYRPWAIINTAGYVKVDDAETNVKECYAVNAEAPGIMAETCRQKGIRFMTFSSDLVFDGCKKDPYLETDSVKPLNVYGSSKAAGEKRVSAANPQSLIIRTSAFFGPWDRYNFIYHVLTALRQDREVKVVNDVVITPTYVPDLVNTALDLFIDEEEGFWHLTNEGMLTWADLAVEVALQNGFKKNKLLHVPLDEIGWKAPRPLYSALESEKGARLPPLDNAMMRYFAELSI